MTPAELRRSVMGAPPEGFQLVLKKSSWPILCRDPAWDISPGGRFFYHFDQEGQMHTIEAEKVEQVVYLAPTPNGGE